MVSINPKVDSSSLSTIIVASDRLLMWRMDGSKTWLNPNTRSSVFPALHPSGDHSVGMFCCVSMDVISNGCWGLHIRFPNFRFPISCYEPHRKSRCDICNLVWSRRSHQYKTHLSHPGVLYDSLPSRNLISFKAKSWPQLVCKSHDAAQTAQHWITCSHRGEERMSILCNDYWSIRSRRYSFCSDQSFSAKIYAALPLIYLHIMDPSLPDIGFCFTPMGSLDLGLDIVRYTFHLTRLSSMRASLSVLGALMDHLKVSCRSLT